MAIQPGKYRLAFRSSRASLTVMSLAGRRPLIPFREVQVLGCTQLRRAGPVPLAYRATWLVPHNEISPHSYAMTRACARFATLYPGPRWKGKPSMACATSRRIASIIPCHYMRI